MGKRNGIGITKMMLGLSSLFLVFVIIGFLEASTITPNMKNSNYMFSDTLESIMFEQLLNENKVPFKKISTNVFSIEPKWKNEADNVCRIILRKTESKIFA